MRKIMIGAAVSVCALVIAAGAGFFLISQKGGMSGPSHGVIVFVVGEASVVKSDGKTAPARPKDEIVSGDTVKTGKGSIVTVQIADQGNVKVNENTVLAFTSVFDKGRTGLVVSQGSIYSKIKKMEKSSVYEVKTPVYVAAVRGTEFLASYDGVKGSVNVADGKVGVVSSPKAGEAAPAAVSAEEIVSAKEGAVVFAEKKASEPDVQRYSLSRAQMLELQKHSMYTDVDASAVDTATKLDSMKQELQKKESEIDAQITVENNMSPLDKLRRDNRPLTMVYLRDGSQIAGSMVSQDESNMRLDTGEGIIVLPVAEIIRRMPIK